MSRETELLSAFLRGVAVSKAKLFLKRFLAPFLPVLAVFVFFAVFLIFLFGAVYSALPRSKDDPAGAGKKAEYERLCAEYNVKDTWVVEGESSPGRPFYPGKGKEYLGYFDDVYGHDAELAMTWGTVHAATLYRAFALREKEITPEAMRKVADGLHPYYYYKESTVTITTEDGETHSYTVHLLVEAYTIHGHYQYHYRQDTRVENGAVITREVLCDVQQILPNRWQRLEDWMASEYRIGREDIDVARSAVWEASRGFDEQSEWLAWLLRNRGEAGVLELTTGSSVPPELKLFFKEAETEHGVPWWFLAAVAWKESRFNPLAVNPRTGCFGLMQVSPSNWEHYAPLLGFDPVKDKWNPRAQVMVGAYLLKNYLGDVDWNSDDWKEQTLPGLTFYSGHRSAGGVIDAAAMERCRAEYASEVWECAERFRGAPSAGWPLKGDPSELMKSISSWFGTRGDPLTGEVRQHNGIDFAAKMGTPVFSVSAGVASVGYDPDGYGNYVVVKDVRYEYYYAHLSAITVTHGQTVQPGEEIGLVGSTGRSTGPHLHFGVRDLLTGRWIDPLLVLGNA